MGPRPRITSGAGSAGTTGKDCRKGVPEKGSDTFSQTPFFTDLSRTIEPVDSLQCRGLKKECRAECDGRDDAKDDKHADEGLVMRGACLHQREKCTHPFERTEQEDDLHQSGNPWPMDEKQADQNQRSKNADQIAITHEVGAENHKAENDGHENQCSFHYRMIS